MCREPLTDEKRREIVQKLRDFHAEHTHERVIGRGRGAYVSAALLCRKVFGINKGWKSECYVPAELVGVLVDLIERPTCRLVEDEEGRAACSECGCTALCMSSASFCPYCGAEVIDDAD